MLHSFGIKSDWNKNFATSNDINVHAKCKRWNAILIATSCAKQNSLHVENNGMRKESTLDLLKENKCLQSDFNVNPIEFHVLIQEAMLLLLLFLLPLLASFSSSTFLHSELKEENFTSSSLAFHSNAIEITK